MYHASSHNYLTARNQHMHALKRKKKKRKEREKKTDNQSTGLHTNVAMTTVTDPVYVRLFLWPTTHLIPTKALSLVLRRLGTFTPPACRSGYRKSHLLRPHAHFVHVVCSHRVHRHGRACRRETLTQFILRVPSRVIGYSWPLIG